MADNTQRFADLMTEFWNTANPELATQVYADDSERFDPNGTEPARGSQEILKVAAEIHAAFPDFRIDMNQRITEDDRYVHCWTCTGTHHGEYQGVPATGKRVQLTGVTVGLMRDGRAMHEETYFDRLALLQQLGVMPGQAPQGQNAAQRP